MKNAVHTRRMGSRIIALSMTLMLLFGLSCPAASAESFLSSHKDEIAGVAAKIYWGTYKLLTKNRKYGINPYEPYYVAVSRPIS